MATTTSSTIAVIGGTGQEGRGLALRWAAAGYPVLIGSRKREKAERKAAELNEQLAGHNPHPIRGLSNGEAAAAADIISLVVPYAAQQNILSDIREGAQGKTILTSVVPLDPANPKCLLAPPDGSAAAEAQRLLGPDVAVVTAFQNVGAHALQAWDRPVDCDIFVCGDDRDAKRTAMDLVRHLGLRPLDAGPLVNAVAVEGLTPILIGLNIRHRARGAGIRVTGLP
ncbi:MAG: NADPH-dependent F420 reductase [Chloroflexi bacterium]|nr:NADPH-dependent F420 reductase [Chloroflexota bacterium]